MKDSIHPGGGARRAVADVVSRAGFTMIELMVVMAILAIAGAMFAQTLASSKRLEPVAEETAIAAEGARSKFEELHNNPFGDIFALYNIDPLDDPGGPGSGPGSRFAVEGLEPQIPGGFVGQVLFPCAGSQLREDVVDSDLCMPRDLDGDGEIDDENHASDWIILPVKVQIDWQSGPGEAGQRSFTIHGMFAKL